METLAELLEAMRRDWDERARTNARHFVNTAQEAWTDEEFLRTGEATVAEQILTDMKNICQGKAPEQMRMLEIGCGAGRITHALAGVFGEIHAVDVSGEMIAAARQALADRSNVFLYQNNGMDLTVVGDLEFDFAFSYIVFQHIPSLEIIESYVREVYRVLRPGGLFKFQVQGGQNLERQPGDTWLGYGISDAEAVELALRCGFAPRYRHGAEKQYFWLWYFKEDPVVMRYLRAQRAYAVAQERTSKATHVLGRFSADHLRRIEEAVAEEKAAEEAYRAARAGLSEIAVSALTEGAEPGA